MEEDVSKPTAVNVIAGHLGAGKTTVINALLALRPENEQWAVLVNEYGLVGLDGALMESEGGAQGVEIKEVSGGCICCSSGLMFQVSLTMLLRKRPDRLLIEPTGLATVSGIMETLEQDGIREVVDVRSVVCLMNPSTFERHRERPEVADQVEAADILLATRADIAPPDDLALFDAWAQGVFPPKSYVGQIEQGKLPLSMLDRNRRKLGHSARTTHEGHHHEGPSEPVAEALQTARTPGPIERKFHKSSSAVTVGWICERGLVFDAKQITLWIRDLTRVEGVLRVKAVLRTGDGWMSFNVADGEKEIRPSGHRSDSRLELIAELQTELEAENLETSLKRCVVA